jgi:threonine/homoserine/homoserine lactone efflux protein
MVFTALKWVGAAYLLYLGISLIRNAAMPKASIVFERRAQLSGRRIVLQGFLTNALNPKVALFFLAFVPQFISPQAEHKTFAFLFLGAIFNVNGTVWNLSLAWSAARFGMKFLTQNSVAVWVQRSIGGLLIALGLRLAMSRES